MGYGIVKTYSFEGYFLTMRTLKLDHLCGILYQSGCHINGFLNAFSRSRYNESPSLLKIKGEFCYDGEGMRSMRFEVSEGVESVLIQHGTLFTVNFQEVPPEKSLIYEGKVKHQNPKVWKDYILHIELKEIPSQEFDDT